MNTDLFSYNEAINRINATTPQTQTNKIRIIMMVAIAAGKSTMKLFIFFSPLKIFLQLYHIM